jgi:hypothetical protein
MPELRTRALKISFIIASVYGLLAKLVGLEVQTVLLKFYYQLWVEIFTSGFLPAR